MCHGVGHVGLILFGTFCAPWIWMSVLCGSVGKKYSCNAGDLGSVPGLGRSSREGKSYPLQYSGLENSMDLLCSSWCCKESDTTEQLSLSLFFPRLGKFSSIISSNGFSAPFFFFFFWDPYNVTINMLDVISESP